MPTPGVNIETLHNPCAYTPHQLDVACRIAAALNRGLFILTTRPLR